MSDATKAIVDYAEQDNASEMRNALYAEIQNRVMAHIEAKKMEVAQNMFKSTQTEAEVEDTTTAE